MIPYADHLTVHGHIRNGHGTFTPDTFKLFNAQFRDKRLTTIETGQGILSLKDNQVRDLIVALLGCVPDIGAKQ